VYDEGMPLPILETRYIEENLWRAIRYGLDGKLVDWAMGEELQAADAIRHLVELAAPYADGIGLSPHLADVERMLRDGNGAQQQARAYQEGKSLEEVFARTVEAAHRSSIAAV
jgi:carboxylate-amine ligase